MSAVVKANREPETASVFERMGKVLGAKLASEADAFRLVSEGVTPRSFKILFSHLKASPSLIGPESTIRRRLKENARFSEAESERLVRLARVFAEAVGLFGDEKLALEWLNTPETWIAGHPPVTPLQLAAKEPGARLIESRIRRTAHGFF